MGVELVDIKFTDETTGMVSFGQSPTQSVDRWLSRGYEEATADEVAVAKGRSLSKDDLTAGLRAREEAAVLAESKALVDPVAPADEAAVLDSLQTFEEPAVASEQVELKDAPVDAVVVDGVVTPVVADPDAAPTDSDAPTAAGDSTAGDDADSTPSEQPARGSRRTR